MQRTFQSWAWYSNAGIDPSYHGAVPVVAVLPDGGRVEMYAEDLFYATLDHAQRHHGYVANAHWISLGDTPVRFRERHSPLTGAYGRSSYTLEIDAPDGTAFDYATLCYACGEQTGLTSTPDVAAVRRADEEELCDDCRARIEAERALYAEEEA